MNRNLTNLVAAAATAASTALLASTVAIETATAATFVYEGPAALGGLGEQLTIESSTATTAEELWGESEVKENWIVKLGEELLEYRSGRGFIRYDFVEVNDNWWGDTDVRILVSSRRGDSVLDTVLRSDGSLFRTSENVVGNWSIVTDDSSEAVKQVPEPSAAIALLGLGAVGVASRLRRRSK